MANWSAQDAFIPTSFCVAVTVSAAPVCLILAKATVVVIVVGEEKTPGAYRRTVAPS